VLVGVPEYTYAGTFSTTKNLPSQIKTEDNSDLVSIMARRIPSGKIVKFRICRWPSSGSSARRALGDTHNATMMTWISPPEKTVVQPCPHKKEVIFSELLYHLIQLDEYCSITYSSSNVFLNDSLALASAKYFRHLSNLLSF